VMRSMHHIQVDRADGEGSLRTALDYLGAGEAVGIFPEATISRALELKEFKTGAVRIAAAAEAPVVPVIVWGTQRMMTKDHDKDFSRGKAITINVGEPVPLTGDAVADSTRLRARMSELLDVAIRHYPQQEPGAWWLPASYGGTAPTLEQAARMDADERTARAARRATKSA
jgi:1-acyl-sn-glycerol-3-phosphate acyltransferase